MEDGKSEADHFMESFIPAEAQDAHLGWAEAVAKDERVQNTRTHVRSQPAARQWNRRSFLAQQDKERTRQRLTSWTRPASSGGGSSMNDGSKGGSPQSVLQWVGNLFGLIFAR